tara:strand:- start:15487 stop:16092 length:606 start_codon:yes stop_codon:yes gene_type:complete
MGILGWPQTKSLVKEKLTGRAWQKVGTAKNFIDSLGMIIHYNCKLIGRIIVSVPHNKITKLFIHLNRLRASETVLEFDQTVIWNSKTPTHFFSLDNLSRTAGARINKAIHVFVWSTRSFLHVFSRAYAWIDPFLCAKVLQSLTININPIALEKRTFIPIQAQPFQVCHGFLCRMRFIARTIEVFHTQNNFSATASQIQPRQ